MSHKLFHNLDVGSLLQQVGGERMAQQVRINPFRDSRFPGRCLQRFDTILSVKGSPGLCSKSHTFGLYSLLYSVSFFINGFDSRV